MTYPFARSHDSPDALRVAQEFYDQERRWVPRLPEGPVVRVAFERPLEVTLVLESGKEQRFTGLYAVELDKLISRAERSESDPLS